MQPDPSKVCDAPGPMVRTSPSYLSQVNCNRARNHPSPHRHYDPQSFHVVAEWREQFDPNLPKKRWH